jgi:hypothetical protein
MLPRDGIACGFDPAQPRVQGKAIVPQGPNNSNSLECFVQLSASRAELDAVESSLQCSRGGKIVARSARGFRSSLMVSNCAEQC